MTVTYVDSSALGRILLPPGDPTPVVTWLDTTGDELVSSDLLETELRRLAVREGVPQAEVSALLDGVSLADLDRATFRSAGLLPFPFLRTLDALHLEAALRLNAERILTYDTRMSEAAAALGLEVVSPE